MKTTPLKTTTLKTPTLKITTMIKITQIIVTLPIARLLNKKFFLTKKDDIGADGFLLNI